MPKPHFHQTERRLQLTKEKIWPEEYPCTSKKLDRFRIYNLSVRNKELLKQHFEALIAMRPDGLERIQRHLEWCAIFTEMLGMDLDKVEKKDILFLQKKILDRYKENKLGTIQGCYISIKQFFRWFYEEYHEQEPPLFIKKIKIEVKPEEYSKKLLSKEDVVKLIDSTTSPNHKGVVSTLYFSGARISELGLSNVEDFEFNGGNETYFSIKHSKTKARKVLILGLGATILRTWFDMYHPGRFDQNFKKQPAFVGIAPHQFKKRLTYSAIVRMLKKNMQKAGIDAGANCHNIRHSFATHMYLDGYTIPEIAKQLGHSDGSKYTFVYAHFGMDEIHNKMREKKEGGKPIETIDPFKFEEARIKHEENALLKRQMEMMQEEMRIMKELFARKLDPEKQKLTLEQIKEISQT